MTIVCNWHESGGVAGGGRWGVGLLPYKSGGVKFLDWYSLGC